MVFMVTLIVLSDGVVERLPLGVTRDEVFGTQGQILESSWGSDSTCQLFWCLTSAYLSSQVNALCSFLSGQLIRGDAILTASLSSPGQAQGWINSIVSKSQVLNASEDRLRSAKSRAVGKQDTALFNPAQLKDSPYPDSTLQPSPGSLPALVRVNEDDTVTHQAAADPATSTSNPVSEDISIPEKRRAPQGSRQNDASRPRAPHIAHAVPDGDYEPRTRLLWSIVSQASSVNWNNRPAAVPQASEAIELPGVPTSSAMTTEKGSLTELPEAESELPPVPERPDDLEAELSTQDSNQGVSRLGCVSKCDDGSILKYDVQSSDWAELQPELLGCIGNKFRSSGPLQVMASTCRSWRTAILGDDQLLKKVHFQDAQSALPLMRRYSEGNACPKATGLPITQLIDKAAKGGNLGACTAVANFLTTIGLQEEGMRYRRRAAKLGDAPSQVALGTAAYSGTCGVMKDGDEAYRWLSRAANKLASLPPSLNTGHLLSRAALHLGFLALDGEATKLDLESSVSWFRLASKCGSRDAEIALGTLLRTGQYGPS